MASASRVLIVDDQRIIVRLVQALLDSLELQFVIVDAVTGEDALQEFLRAPFALVVTRMRLPGMHGLELAEEILKASPNTAVAVVEGDASEVLYQRAVAAGVAAYLPAPLDTAELAKLIRLLYGFEEAVEEEETVEEEPEEEVEPPDPLGPVPEVEIEPLAARISTLFTDVGALVVLLADRRGNVLAKTGSIKVKDEETFLQELGHTFSRVEHFMPFLGGKNRNGLYFYEGSKYDLYGLNVGVHFYLATVFEGGRGSSKMGSMVRYGRRCVDDLMKKIGKVANKVEAPPPVEPAKKKEENAPAEAAPKTGGLIKVTPLSQRPEPAVERVRATPIVVERPQPAAAPAPPPPAPAAPKTPARPKKAAPASAPAAIGGLDDLAALLDQGLGRTDADAFWEQVVDSDSGDLGGAGESISFEEARELGLLPGDLSNVE